MSTVYSEGVWRVEVTGTKVTGDPQFSPVVMLPEGVSDLCLWVKGSAASTAKVYQSPSSGVAVQSGVPAADWLQVDATLDAVGTTMVKYVVGALTPVALKVESLNTDQTATLIITGKRN